MGFTDQELHEALRAVVSLLSKLEKTLGKLTPGTSQHTLATNRIAALRVSQALIEAELAGKREGATPRRS